MARRRLFTVLVAFVVLFGAVVVKLADVQVIRPDRFEGLGQQQRIVSSSLPAWRGSIVDREGVDLALSLPQQTVFADPLLVNRSGKASETADELARVLGLPRNELYRTITGRGRFAVLAHTVADEVAAELAELDLPGIATYDEFKRYLPNGDLARSLLGRVSVDGTGYSGLETQYESLLAGTPGSLTYERRGRAGAEDGSYSIAGGRQEVVPAEPGADVVLTIDRALQYQTERVLAEHVAAQGAKGGTAVITRPGSGEILAMANVVADPETGEVHVASNNLALTTVFEPGSVNKVITVAAAMDRGLITPDTPIEVPDQLQVSDHLFKDAHGHATQTWTPTDILVTSSNIGTIKIGQMLGPEGVDRALRDFGLGRPSGLDFPNESSGLMLDLDDWSGTSIGAIPIGQGVSVTAMQMLGAFNVLANGGVAVAPRLVDATVDSEGRRRQRPPSARHRVVSEDTAAKMRAMMAQVVASESGTGTKAAVPGYTVAGKTGTARKPVTPHMEGDGYRDLAGNYHYVATFAGFVPAENPQLSVIVVIDEPTGSIYASEVSAPVFSELARYALRRYDIPPAVLGGDAGVPEVSESAREIGGAQLPASATERPATIPAEADGTGAGADGGDGGDEGGAGPSGADPER